MTLTASLAIGGPRVLPGDAPGAQQGLVPAEIAGSADPRIGAISIEVLDIFDTSVRSESNPLARAANLLHLRTRVPVVRRELLFKTGDRLDPEALSQTERNLRALGLFRRVEVRALPPENGIVRVLVRVHDAWSLATGTSFRREGGFDSYDVRLRENNVAGLGMGLAMRYAVGFERRERAASFTDARLLGSRERIALVFASRSDGSVREFSLSRPFYSLASPSGHGVGWRTARERYRTYEDGRVLHEYNLSTADGAIGWSGRIGAVRRGSAWRIGGGYRYVAREYTSTPWSRPGEEQDMPASYRRGGPYVGLQFLQHRYETRRDLIAPDRDSDFNLGLNANVEVFVSSPRTGLGTDSRLVAGLSLERGWRLPGGGLTTVAGRVGAESGGRLPARGDVSGTVRAWFPHSKVHLTAVFAEGHAWVNPDRGVLDYLGGTPGLRGFRENQFAGTRSLLVIVEERKYFAWRLAGLVRPGIVAFAEVGAIGGGGPLRAGRIVHADVGVGLRLVRLRSAPTSVIKVDVAAPIGVPWRGGRAVQVVVGFQRDF